MTHAAALRKARSFYRLASDERTPKREREAAARRLKEICDRYQLTRAEVSDEGYQILIVPVGPWRANETDLVGAVISVVGARLVPTPDSGALLMTHALDMPRLLELTRRLIDIYKREGERLDRAASNWRSFAFTSNLFTPYLHAPGPDKASFLGGLTFGLIDRLSPPPPPPDPSCTALVRAFRVAEPTADSNAAPVDADPVPQKAMKSRSDFVAGVMLSKTVDLTASSRKLNANPTPLENR